MPYRVSYYLLECELSRHGRWARLGARDEIHGPAAMDCPSRKGGRVAADHCRSGLEPGDRRHCPPCPGEEGSRAAVREHQGIQEWALHQAVCERSWCAITPRSCSRL